MIGVGPEVYSDLNGLARLRQEASNAPQSEATLRAVAEQFEALFLQMMLKSMRATVSDDGLFSNEETRFYQDMFDQQLSVTLPKQGGIGLADVIVEQLSQQTGATHSATAGDLDQLSARATFPLADTDVSSLSHDTADAGTDHASFIGQILPAIEHAASRLGVNAEAIMAQAVLETGWGKSVIRHSDGRNSHNLFGIKADAGWHGERVTSRTFEFIGGTMRSQTADFRSYPSYQAAIDDYVDFIAANDRYRNVIAQGADANAMAEALQASGYATDPLYARKLQNVMAGETFRTLMVVANR